MPKLCRLECNVSRNISIDKIFLIVPLNILREYHWLSRKVGIVGFLTNCRGITGHRVGRGRRSKLQVRADALMAARRKERETSMSFLVCDVLLSAVRYIGPNDRPLRTAMRYPHAPLERSLFFLFPSCEIFLFDTCHEFQIITLFVKESNI